MGLNIWSKYRQLYPVSADRCRNFAGDERKHRHNDSISVGDSAVSQYVSHSVKSINAVIPC